jgi:hypothetical protein
MIIGTVEIIDCLGPLTSAELDDTEHLHRVSAARRSKHPRWRYAWTLGSPCRLRKPVTYQHPSGAVTWISLPQMGSRSEPSSMKSSFR